MTARCVAFLIATLLVAPGRLPAQESDASVGPTLSRVAEYVENYYSRAQSIVARETVTVQNVGPNMSAEGFARRFVYNLHVDWVPSGDGPPEASLARELMTVNGRPPKEGDEQPCTAPKPITPEPLAMFLPQRQSDFVFDNTQQTRLDGRSVVRFDYRVRRPEPDKVSWDRECVSMDFQGRLRGRVWVDATTGEVLRIDEGANGPVDMVAPREQQRRGTPAVVVFDRFVESVRYRPVKFQNPDETLLLPASIESTSMSRSGGTRRSQKYSDYRRFVTDGRLVP